MRRAVLVLLPLLGACAAVRPEPARSAESPVVAAPPAVSVAAPPPPPPLPLVNERVPGALAEVVNAEQALEASVGSCVAACRALGSMDSATGHLCRLSTTTEEQRECVESKSKVIAARARVAAACGSCPGGPSVDPGAPVPSH